MISKCSGDIIILLYKNGLSKNVHNVIRFGKNQKYQYHVHKDDIQDALSLSIAIF